MERQDKPLLCKCKKYTNKHKAVFRLQSFEFPGFLKKFGAAVFGETAIYPIFAKTFSTHGIIYKKIYRPLLGFISFVCSSLLFCVSYWRRLLLHGVAF
jgi:hypothetical protein